MKNVVSLHRKMRPDEFEAEVRSRAAFSHMVGFSDHAKDRAQERGVTIRQILNVLRKGSICKGPTYSAKHGNYEGTMEYYGTGRRLRVACALDDGKLTITVITAY